MSSHQQLNQAVAGHSVAQSSGNVPHTVFRGHGVTAGMAGGGPPPTAESFRRSPLHSSQQSSDQSQMGHSMFGADTPGSAASVAARAAPWRNDSTDQLAFGGTPGGMSGRKRRPSNPEFMPAQKTYAMSEASPGSGPRMSAKFTPSDRSVDGNQIQNHGTTKMFSFEFAEY